MFRKVSRIRHYVVAISGHSTSRNVSTAAKAVLPLEKKIRENRETLIYEFAQPSDVDEVFEGLLAHFFPRTPVRQIHLFDESPETRRPVWKLEEVRQSCSRSKGFSIIVREKSTSRLVAYSGGTIEESSETNIIPLPFLKDDRTVGWLARALDAELYRGLDPFKFFNTNRVLLYNLAFVHPDYGRSGIVFEMYQLAARRAVMTHGVGVGLGTASGNYSRKASIKAGGRILRTLDYATFQLPDGTRPFSGVDMGEHCTRYLVAGLPPDCKTVAK